MYLKGSAKEFYRELEQATKEDYEELKKAILEEYDTSHRKQHAASLLYQRAQRPGESVRDYACALRILCRAAFDDNVTTEMKDHLILNIFLSKIRPDLKPAFVLNLPQDLKQAVTWAESFERRKPKEKLNQTAYAVEQVSSSNHDKKVDKLLSQISDQLEDL